MLFVDCVGISPRISNSCAVYFEVLNRDQHCYSPM
jgi:hypothetical protein